jgi:hypothetical protein
LFFFVSIGLKTMAERPSGAVDRQLRTGTFPGINFFRKKQGPRCRATKRICFDESQSGD